jgi:hypothetical protein
MGGLTKVVVQAARSNTPVIAVDHPRVKRQQGNKTRGATFGSLLLWPSWLVDTL